jgi:hypothetical protein
MFLGIVCAVIFGVGQRAGDLIMSLIRLIIQLLCMRADGSMESIPQRVLSQVPNSIDAVFNRFKIKGVTTAYAVCPVCHCTFPPSATPDKFKYPERCTNRPKPEGEPCNEPLLQDTMDGNEPRPRKIFLYHHFADYLAGLISQHEDVMDKSCDDCVESLEQPPPAFVSNVFEAEFIKTFEGPIPGRLFVQRPSGEGRYLFALNVDFFNVEGLRVRGASTSCGIISLACLNLPIDIRYKTENMYLLIIPGPAEPSLTDMNHYLRPLIGDMVDAWDKGIHISRTPRYPDGRTTRSAIAVSVNDLPAARKTAALASHSSHFYCSRCECHHLSTRGNTNCQTWKTRDPKKMRQQAEAWRDATSSVEQTKLFQASGVRWSELWRLSYWDPTRQLVVDAMHCILEGLAKYHSKEALCLTSASAEAKLDAPPPFVHDFQPPPDTMTARQQKEVTQTHSLLSSTVPGGDLVDEVQQNLAKLSDRLHRKSNASLQFVVDDLGLTVHPNPIGPQVIRKRDLVEALIEWVRSACTCCPPCKLTSVNRGQESHWKIQQQALKCQHQKSFTESEKLSEMQTLQHGCGLYRTILVMLQPEN